MRLWALLKDGQRREVTVEDLWPHKSFLVLKFQGLETINNAEPLIGAELQLPRGERAELEPGWTYLSDLIGCAVFDGQREVGEIEDVQFGAGEAPLLVVRSKEQATKRRGVSGEAGSGAEASLDEVAGRLAGSERSTGKRGKGKKSLVVRCSSFAKRGWLTLEGFARRTRRCRG
jgi:hypothetical protein